MARLLPFGLALVALFLTNETAAAAEGEPYRLRGTVAAVDDQLLTVMNDDEETFEVTLSEDTGLFAVTPGKWSDIRPGQFVGVTSVETGDQRVALEVHIFAEDLRGTGEGHYPWDLVKDPNMMTNATIAEIEEVNPAQRQLRLTYKEGEGASATQGEQIIAVPDFVDVVFLAKSDDLSLIMPGRKAFLLVRDTEQGPPAAIVVAVGLEGAAPPM
jgi:hypothetical protein